jgi:hypothetical protein
MTDAATGQPAAGQTTGSEQASSGSFLTSIANAQGADTNTQPANGATPAASPASDRPAYVPEKFWRDGQPDIEGLGKGYQSLEQLLGSEKVPVPKSWEDKESVDRWYKAAGRPDNPKGYEFEKPDKLPQGFYDDTAEASAREWFHQNGLNPVQAKNLHKAFVKTQLERHAAYEEQQRQAKMRVENDLIREHGQGYDSFKKAAKAALTRFADPDLLKYMDETGSSNDPRVIRAFGKIGKAMMGDASLRGEPKVEVNTADLDQQINEHFAKHNKALLDRTHPEHAQRVAERQKLFTLRFPEPQP